MAVVLAINATTGKILHICESIKGGIASYLDEVASFQIEKFGMENVRFFIPKHSRSELPSIPDECIITFDYSGRRPVGLLKYIRAVAALIRHEKPDIIHAHSSFAGLASRVVFVGRRRDPYLVYCPHGWSFLAGVTGVKRQLRILAERFLVRYTDAIINISQYEQAQSLAVGLPAAKSHVVLSGIKLSPLIQGISLPQSRINLLFVGRYDRQKGFDVLLEVMRRVSDLPLHLYVVGGGVLEQVTPPQLDNVTYLGWLNRNDIAAYYAGADAVVMPSRWEAFGLVAIEAMRCATAVLASDRGALPELVVAEETGLIFRGEDPVALESALRTLDKDVLQKWGRAGQKRQVENFSVERMNSELLGVYETIV